VEHLVAGRATALGRTCHIGLGVVRTNLAALRLHEAHVGGEVPGICPLPGFDTMGQCVVQRVSPRDHIPGCRPDREPMRQRAVIPAKRSRADCLCDLPADRIVVQPVLGHGAVAATLDEELARATHERPPLRFAGPAGHGTQLVERERLARGAQDTKAIDDGRLGRDPLPRDGQQRREAARNALDAALRRGETRQVLAQHRGVLQVTARACNSLGHEPRIEAELRRSLLPERAHRRFVIGREGSLIIEIDLHRAAGGEHVHVRMARPARA
jgi:hypothetical protein